VVESASRAHYCRLAFSKREPQENNTRATDAREASLGGEVVAASARAPRWHRRSAMAAGRQVERVRKREEGWVRGSDRN
jgi:hypothetical protein